jgi:ATP-dependent Lhr-like helicase
MDGAAPLLLPAKFEAWFAERGWRPRRHQVEMVQKAREGRHVLLMAPTGGGKTLSGFLPSLIDLATRPPRNDPVPPGVHTLYLSPLKALAVDVERNLLAPIREMKLGVTVESRTGDSSVAKRQRQRQHPPDILLTTPEQLALFCAWDGARAYFADLKTVILDEIHAVWPSKRGDLLALGLQRLQSFAPDLRRVGLSATVDDPDLIRRWMSPGDAPVDTVQGEPGPPPQVEVLVSGGHVPWMGHTAQHAIADIYELIRQSRTTLVFVNTRWQAEFAFQELWAINDENLPIALHHGSLAAEQRRKVEAAMARGDLRAVVCTSTLDLGIDWGDVDLVIQLAAPKGSSRLVQRIGRANHRLDTPSRAILTPANRFEVLECEAARAAVAENALDGEVWRNGAFDVLAQHVMGVACSEPFAADDLYAEVIQAGPYKDLSRGDFDDVVAFVSDGGYALRTYDRFRRIVKGRDGFWKVRNAQLAQRHRMNVGAIHAAGTLNIRVGGSKRGGPGRKIGEAEEFYFEQLTPGDTFIFGGSVWRFDGIRGMDALVSPSTDKEPKVPSWGGSKFPLSTYLALRVRRMIHDEAGWERLTPDVREWLEIQKRRSVIPGPEDMLVETFPRGRRHYLVCYPFDGRISHSTLAMLLTRRLERAGIGPLGFVATDYGLAIWSVRPMDRLDFDELFQEDMLGDDLESWLDESFMMKRTFRQCATISGLIERRVPGMEKTGRQVTFSTDLIYDVLRRHQPDHLLLRAARADAATGLLDVARLGRLLNRVRGRIVHADLARVSPFAVTVMLQIGKERVAGETHEMILDDQAEALIAEAMS